MIPADIDPDSGFRLPLPKREAMDADGQRLYDEVAHPTGINIRGLRGPGGIQLYSPKLARFARPLNRYLRQEAGLSPRLREVAILVTAREFSSQFEWAAHEPEALKAGVPRATIEIIKHRRPASGLAEEDAAIIALGREAFGAKQVSSATFARVLKAFGAHQLADIVALMGNYAGTAILLATFDMQLDDGQEPMLPLP